MNKALAVYVSIALVLISLGIKMVHVTTFSIQLDEPFSIFTSNLNWSEFWNIFLNENNPPLHPILLKLVISVFGLNEFWMRFLSVLVSSVAVWFLYKGVEKISSYKEALISSCCLIFSNLQIMYAHQIRAYALLVLLSTMSFYFLIKIIKDNKNRDVALLGITLTLMMFTHFMGIICTAFLSVSILFFWKNVELRKKLFYSFLISAILFSPYLPIFFTRFLSSSGGTWVDIPSGLMDIYFNTWKFFNAPLTTIIGLIILISSFILLKKENQKLKFLTFLNIQILLSLVGIFAFSYVMPLYLDRYLIFLSPFLYASVAITVVHWSSYIKLKYLRIPAYILIPILFIVTFKIDSDINQSDDLKWETIKEHKQELPLVISPSWEDLNYCYYQNKDYYFVDSRSKFDSLRLENKIILDYEFIKNWSKYNDSTILVYTTNLDGNLDLKKILSDKFIVEKKITDYLTRYRILREGVQM